LSRRIFDLVKSKYPRTEFLPVSFIRPAATEREDESDRTAIRIITGETDMLSLFREADTLLLLSPGGLGRYLVDRAMAAAMPIVTNDFAPAGGTDYCIRGIRDSYSALAEELIRLADDDAHYLRSGQSSA
jgi:hypothetical protein